MHSLIAMFTSMYYLQMHEEQCEGSYQHSPPEHHAPPEFVPH